MPPLVFIAGMHRSGTSLTAQAFQAAGFHMGSELVEASQFNRRGYVEPKGLVAFHDRLLADNGTSWHDTTAPKLRWDDHTIREAQELLAHERHPEKPTALKDPRTTLFLDLWRTVAPDATFVLPFRRPGAVVQSLLRRGDVPAANKLARATRALALWRLYNERVLRLHSTDPDRCCVLEPPHGDLAKVVAGRWGIPEGAAIDLGDTYELQLMATTKPWLRALAEADPRTRRVERRLERAAAAD